MLFIGTRRSKLTSSLLVHFTRKAHLSSISHLTTAERHLYSEHLEAKSRLPPKPIRMTPPLQQSLQPQIYNAESSTWVGYNDSHRNCLPRGSVLNVVSWNIDGFRPGEATRANTALNHLRELFGTAPGQLVVMLQDVCIESLRAMLARPWIRQNFIVTNVKAPKSIYSEISGETFTSKETSWRSSRYFTVMMIEKSLGNVGCFRAPFTTDMGRDALCVDIPISDADGRTRSNDSLRLCTTHLESRLHGKAYHPGQLSIISRLLKQPQNSKFNIIAGLVGGDMNVIDQTEHDLHRSSDIDLKDVWEDVPAPVPPALKPFKKDMSFGRAKGNTWGYQSERGNRMRRDKFLYTGLVETVAPVELQDITGRLGRVGIDLKVEVEAWERETTDWTTRRGKMISKPSKRYFSDHQMLNMEVSRASSLVRTNTNMWVSGHFGIATGIMVDPAI